MRNRLSVPAALVLSAVLAASCAAASGESVPIGSANPARCQTTNPPLFSNGFKAVIGPDTGTGYGIRDVGKSGTTDLVLDNCSFAPTVLRGSSWQTLTVNLYNDSAAEHNFSVPAENLSVDLRPWERRQVEVQVPGTGGVEFLCRFHRDQGMIGAVAAHGFDLPSVLAAPPGNLATGSVGTGGYRGAGHIGPGTTDINNDGKATKQTADSGGGKNY